MKITYLFVLASLVLAACGVVLPGGPPTATAVPTNAPQATYTPLPTYTPYPTTVAPTAQPTTTAQPTEAPATGVPEGQADVRGIVNTTTVNGWTVTTYEGVTDQITDWANSLKAPVTDWSEFPNVDFARHDFLARDGVEYGMAESAYCQQGQTCDVNVPARHYRLITGDYVFDSIDSCTKKLDTDPGCGIAFFNVGEVTAMFRNQHVDYGFTVNGRFWNGDAMPTTIWALMSNTAFNMLNKGGNSVVNRGANCSLAAGCKSVRLTVVIMSGNQILAKATTIVK